MSEDYSILSNYEFKKDIGEGNFGKVKLAIFKPTGEEYAIKILNKERIKQKMRNITFRENEIILKFNHINIVYVYQIIDEPENYFIIMEYCKSGDLFDYIVANKRLNEDEASVFFYQLINGVEYLHKLGYAHRDLKPENLLLSKNKTLKIIDFGLSREYDSKQLLTTKCGSPSYASPELIMGKPYDAFKTDIWSCGIILYGMLCGYLPFDGNDTKQLFMEILNCSPEYPFILSDDAKNLIDGMLQCDPEDRLSIEEIKKSELYLNGKRLCKIDYEKLNEFLIKRNMFYRGKQTSYSQNDDNDRKKLKLFFSNKLNFDSKRELHFNKGNFHFVNNNSNNNNKNIYLKTANLNNNNNNLNRNLINTFRKKVVNNNSKNKSISKNKNKNKNLLNGPILFTETNNLSPKKDITAKTKGKSVEPKLLINPSKKKLNQMINNNYIKSFSVNKKNSIQRNNFLSNKMQDEKIKFNNITKRNNIASINTSYNNLFNNLNAKRDNKYFLSPQVFVERQRKSNSKNNNKNSKNILLKINKLNINTVITQINNKKREMPSSPINIYTNKLFLNSLITNSLEEKEKSKNKNKDRFIEKINNEFSSPIRKKDLKIKNRASTRRKIKIKEDNAAKNGFEMVHCNSEKSSNFFPLIEN